MNENDIIKMCQRLAKKYKDPQEYDDLVSEGVLKALEVVAKGKTDKNLLYSYIQGAMNEYYNIRKHTVHVPVQDKAKRFSVENDPYNWTEIAMFNVLYSETAELDENSSTTPSVEIEYEQKEWIRYIKKKMIEVLDEEELKIIDMRYFSNMTQDDVSKHMSHNQVWVHRKEKEALRKIKNSL
jgi:RNA polymerase sigma factor (sigma-70 family)